jgi:hypothetical protein
MVALTISGEICGTWISLSGVPSCFDVLTEQSPPTWTSGTRPSVVHWITTLRRNSNSVPVAAWSIKNHSGMLVSGAPVDGHHRLAADGMSQALAHVINTAEAATFQFTGGFTRLRAGQHTTRSDSHRRHEPRHCAGHRPAHQ